MRSPVCYRACRAPDGRFFDHSASGKCERGSRPAWVGFVMQRRADDGQFSRHLTGAVVCGGRKFGG